MTARSAPCSRTARDNRINANVDGLTRESKMPENPGKTRENGGVIESSHPLSNPTVAGSNPAGCELLYDKGLRAVGSVDANRFSEGARTRGASRQKVSANQNNPTVTAPAAVDRPASPPKQPPRPDSAAAGKDPADNPCADALDELWRDIILARRPDYGDWEYPGFAYRHLLAEFNDVRDALAKLVEAVGDGWSEATVDAALENARRQLDPARPSPARPSPALTPPGDGSPAAAGGEGGGR